MANFTPKPTLQLKVVIELTEEEAGALQAISGYDTDAFLKMFYREMGRNYLEPYEAGLRSLFKSAFQTIPGFIDKAKTARELFK